MADLHSVVVSLQTISKTACAIVPLKPNELTPHAPVLTTRGYQWRAESVEHWLRRDAIGEGPGRFADLRYTEYLRGAHDAWTRTFSNAQLAKWAFMH